MYGEGVKKNVKEAFQWNTRAAEAGDATGIRNLAICYDLGTGTSRDAIKAIEWYKKLLEIMGNDRFAMYRISLCLCNPDKEYAGKPTDDMYKEAMEFAERAVAAGEQNANYVIGYLYMIGKVVIRDYNKAVSYFSLAAKHGNSKAKEKIERFTKSASGKYTLK